MPKKDETFELTTVVKILKHKHFLMCIFFGVIKNKQLRFYHHQPQKDFNVFDAYTDCMTGS